MPSRNLKDAVKELRDKYNEILHQFEFEKPGYTLNITCTHRTPEEQHELFKKGRILDIDGHVLKIDHSQVVTNCDGIHILSAHNYYPSRAVDVVVIDTVDHKAHWEEWLYSPLVAICNKLGLTNGGSWTTFKDWPHIEVKNYKNYKVTEHYANSN